MALKINNGYISRLDSVHASLSIMQVQWEIFSPLDIYSNLKSIPEGVVVDGLVVALTGREEAETLN